MYTIHDLQVFAISKNGQCLSQKYKTNNTNYNWVCSRGHNFNKQWLVVKNRNSWCNICNLGHYIEFLQEYASKNNGQCLSSNFTDSKRTTKYKFRCGYSHDFDLTYVQIKKNVWCKFCKNTQNHYTIDSLQKYAQEHEGECLSSTYTTITIKYTWKCHYGHKWDANWHNMVYGKTWCPTCNLWTLDKFEEFAVKKKGSCLLIEGSGLRGKYEWNCEKGHKWITKGGNIIFNKTWCPTCLKLDISICHEEAVKRKGECLQQEYINKRSLMKWKCEKGHIFNMTMGAVRNNGRWCPKCTYKSESACRDVFENIYPYKFPKRRLNCLEYLELDGYCEELSLGWEYIPHFHRNGEDDLLKQKERDQKKDELCRINGIMLIRIPHKYSYNEPDELENYIYSELEKNGF
jgi:hypothetical protein